MDFGHYAARAVALVNTDVATVEQLEALVGTGSPRAGRVNGDDLAALAGARAELRAAFEAGAAGDHVGVVAAINAMLGRYPMAMRISGHDGMPWHLHVNDEEIVAAGLVAQALFGLTVIVTELGADRFGVCGAEGCDIAYVDTSPNRSRRFCGDRCATRTNVAAFRRRRSARAS